MWLAGVWGVMLVTASLAWANAPEASGPPIAGASSTQHVWFVLEEPQPEKNDLPRVFRLFHHAAAMEEATLTSESLVPALSQFPAAMAAWESQLWIVNHANPKLEHPRREVFTIRVHYDATFEVYQHEPRERLQSLEPLPADGHLAGFVALASGPVALLVPTERGTSSVVTPAGEARNSGELHEPVLLALEGGEWKPIALPDDITPRSRLRLGANQAGDGTLFLFAASPDDPGAAVLYQLTPNGWESSEIPLELEQIRGFTNVLGQCVAVVSARGSNQASLAIIRPGDVLRIATFEAPESPWSVFGLAGDLRLITRTAPAQIFVQRIDPLTGTLGERVAFTTLRPSTAGLFHLPVLLLLAIVAVSLSFALGKDNADAPLNLPAGLIVLGPVARLVALGVDMVPAGFVTMLLLRCEFSELLRPPTFVARFDLAEPYLLMAGLTILYTGVWELINGASLGKSMVHARVTDLHGRRLPVRATLIRIAFKAVVMYVPVLAIFNLMNNRGQGLGDRAVGAVVLTEQEQEQHA